MKDSKKRKRTPEHHEQLQDSIQNHDATPLAEITFDEAIKHPQRTRRRRKAATERHRSPNLGQVTDAISQENDDAKPPTTTTEKLSPHDAADKLDSHEQLQDTTQKHDDTTLAATTLGEAIKHMQRMSRRGKVASKHKSPIHEQVADVISQEDDDARPPTTSLPATGKLSPYDAVEELDSPEKPRNKRVLIL